MNDCANDASHGSLRSLWGRDAQPGLDLRMCPACGDSFFWDGAPTHVARTTALVVEELLTGTSRPRQTLAGLVTTLTAPQLAALVDHLGDEPLALVREALLELRPVAPREVAIAITGRLMEPTTRPEPPLPDAELAGFWALGIPLEATWVGAAELSRAADESRVQHVESYSCMGTAETGWARGYTTAGECAVVPPGELAEQTEDPADERDTTLVCWEPFWSRQVIAALKHVPGGARRYVLQECARRLRELERRDADAEAATRQRLVGWLSEPPTDLERELEAVKSSALRPLVNGVRARWLTFDCHAAVQAVIDSANGSVSRARWYNDGTARAAAARMDLLRFVVQLVSG